MYTRARVAVGGLLALDKKETIYFDASTDDEGQPLRGECDYRIEGRDLLARWWSLTAYGSDHFLIPDERGRYSFSKTTTPMDRDGRFALRVSAFEQPGAWLPTVAGDRFYLTIRLYNPDPSIQEDPTATELPRIVRERCL